MDVTLKDQVVVVTGGGSGIGEATARYFASRGAKVCLTGRTAQELDRVSNSLRQEGYFCESYACSLTKDSDIANLFSQVAQTAGPIHTVVNNATLSDSQMGSELPAEEWPAAVADNLNSSFVFAKEAFRVLKNRGGNIINISALAGIPVSDKFNGYPAFSLSRAALIGFTEALAAEGESFGIRVNVIAPSDVKNQSASPDPKFTGPSEIAKVIFYLADRAQSGKLNGTVIQIPSHV